MKRFYSLLFLSLFCASFVNAMEERSFVEDEAATTIQKNWRDYKTRRDFAATTIQKNWKGHKARRDVANQVFDELTKQCFSEFLTGQLNFKEAVKRFKKLPNALKPYVCTKFLMLVFLNIKSNLPERRISPDFLKDLFAFVSAVFNEQQTYLFRLLKDELFEGSRNKDLLVVARKANIVFRLMKSADDALKSDPSAADAGEHKAVLEDGLKEVPSILKELHDKCSSPEIKGVIVSFGTGMEGMLDGYKLLIKLSRIPGFNFVMLKKSLSDMGIAHAQELIVNYLDGKNNLFDCLGREALAKIVENLSNFQILQHLIIE